MRRSREAEAGIVKMALRTEDGGGGCQWLMAGWNLCSVSGGTTEHRADGRDARAHL